MWRQYSIWWNTARRTFLLKEIALSFAVLMKMLLIILRRIQPFNHLSNRTHESFPWHLNSLHSLSYAILIILFWLLLWSKIFRIREHVKHIILFKSFQLISKRLKLFSLFTIFEILLNLDFNLLKLLFLRVHLCYCLINNSLFILIT